MKKNIIILTGVVVVILIIVFAFTGGDTAATSEIVVDVKKGEFNVDITTTGEL